MYDNFNIKFKTSMIRSNLCDCIDAYILVEGTITVPNTTAAGAAVNNTGTAADQNPSFQINDTKF